MTLPPEWKFNCSSLKIVCMRRLLKLLKMQMCYLMTFPWSKKSHKNWIYFVTVNDICAAACLTCNKVGAWWRHARRGQSELCICYDAITKRNLWFYSQFWQCEYKASWGGFSNKYAKNWSNFIRELHICRQRLLQTNSKCDISKANIGLMQKVVKDKCFAHWSSHLWKNPHRRYEPSWRATY